MGRLFICWLHPSPEVRIHGATAAPPAHQLPHAMEGTCSSAWKGRKVVQGNSDWQAQGLLQDKDKERSLCREQQQCRAQLDTSFKQMELAKHTQAMLRVWNTLRKCCNVLRDKP